MRLLIIIGRLSPYILAVTVPAFILLVVLYSLVFETISLNAEEPSYVVIPGNLNDDQLAKVLKENKLVGSEFIGKILINKQRKKTDKFETIPPGEYEIPPKLTPSKIIASLLTSKPFSRTFEIKAGMTVEDIAQVISEAGLFPQAIIEKALTKSETLVQRGIPASVPEGYFIPMSTSFSKPIETEEVVTSLLNTSKEQRQTAFPNLAEIAFNYGLDEFKILTIASMIEKSGARTLIEKKRVSTVIHNRLALNLPQENEMALRYFYGDFLKPLEPTAYTRESPFNTFIKRGLPPTPICTPSLDSLGAALMPEDSDFLYYLVSPQGPLVFSPTLEDFNNKRADLGLTP